MSQPVNFENFQREDEVQYACQLHHATLNYAQNVQHGVRYDSEHG